MAEEVQQSQAQPASGGASQGFDQGGQSQGTTETPEWNRHFRSADDMYRSYGELHSRLGQQGNELGQYRQAAQEAQAAAQAWNTWYRTNLQPRWGDIQRLIQGEPMQQQAREAPQPQQQAAQWAEGWEMLSPSEQAQRLNGVVLNQAVQQIAQMVGPAIHQWQTQFVTHFNQDMARREAYYNNYLNLYRQVMDMRMRDPNLDVDKVLDQAVNVLSNQVNPLELGKTLATMGSEREVYAKQMVEQAKKDWEQAQQNKNMAAVGGNNSSPPAFRPVSAGGDRGLSGMREQVAQKILEKHGPAVFGGGNR